jgi:hypothetical protein
MDGSGLHGRISTKFTGEDDAKEGRGRNLNVRPMRDTPNRCFDSGYPELFVARYSQAASDWLQRGEQVGCALIRRLENKGFLPSSDCPWDEWCGGQAVNNKT